MAYKGVFKENISRTQEALEWVDSQDVEGLRSFFMEDSYVPLYCIGSGGSFSPLEYAAQLYEVNQGMAKAVTPLMLDSISDDTLKRSKVLVLTSSGKGWDEKYVSKRVASVKPMKACAVVRNESDDNYVLKYLSKIDANSFVYNWPTQEGSFIATIETVCKFGLFYRAFTNTDGILDNLTVNLEPCHCFTYRPRMEGEIPLIKDVKNFIVLYNGWSKPVAIDFESKMVESGIASVQLCDYRNFCHGRFIFLSNHLADSVLVLFLTPREHKFVKDLFDGVIWRENREAFPRNTPIIKVESELDSPLASIDLLIKMQVLFDEIAKAFDTEPCKPNNPCKIDKRFPKNTPFKNYRHPPSPFRR